MDHRNTCVSIKIRARTVYVFVPGHGRPGAPVSPPLSLWTDCLHRPPRRQLGSEVKGLGFRGS